ncbi:MAG: peptide-methionine (R)-S-oxide reductase [Hyphomicrobiales bacterium]|nr:peptide-methionine (R)-S-oxide reductase MsrB [Hyphomicrobiales bacterium]PCJ84745.1 MAG: peptide-methionine (R)-S-oxide reductase [Hyphomicrobiales bacterium]
MAKQNREPTIVKTDEEWRELLSEEQYVITRQAGTEPSGTGPDSDQKADGIYRCVGCDTVLFKSETKFDSGTGWPSFFAPADEVVVNEFIEGRFFMKRTEVRCATCDAHLGHVFTDGPQPTGLRYCMNGYAMNFEKDA